MGTKLSPVGSSQSGGGSIGPTTPTDFTEGSVIFAGADYLAENNAAFKWDNTTNKENLQVTSDGDSDTATLYAMNLLFNGTRGLKIRSTNAGAFFPAHVRLENVAYGTYCPITVGNFNGLYSQVVGQGKWHFDSALSGTCSRFAINTAGSALSEAVADVLTSFATQVGHRIKLAATPTANAIEVLSNADAVLTAILAGGGLQPASMADGSAPNNSLYYSTTASKLVYKDAGGVVNALY